jgi:hypothetical protein
MAAPTGRPEGTEAVAVRVDPAAAARLLFGVLLFVSYPLALVIPVRFGISLVFHIAVPTFLLFSLFCIGYLLTVSPGKIGDARPSPAPSDRSLDLARVAGGLLAAYAAIVLVSATSGHTARFEDVFLALGAVCAPAFFALCPRRWLPKNLTALLAGLWLAQAVHGILQLSRGHEPVLLAGNRNWAATLVAVLTPWACLAVRSCRRRWQFRWVRWAEPLAHAGIILACARRIRSFFRAFSSVVAWCPRRDMRCTGGIRRSGTDHVSDQSREDHRVRYSRSALREHSSADRRPSLAGRWPRQLQTGLRSLS